jgi:hypothetical protein
VPRHKFGVTKRFNSLGHSTPLGPQLFKHHVDGTEFAL